MSNLRYTMEATIYGTFRVWIESPDYREGQDMNVHNRRTDEFRPVYDALKLLSCWRGSDKREENYWETGEEFVSFEIPGKFREAAEYLLRQGGFQECDWNRETQRMEPVTPSSPLHRF